MGPFPQFSIHNKKYTLFYGGVQGGIFLIKPVGIFLIKPVGLYPGTYCFFNQPENKGIITVREKGEIYSAEICI